MCVFFILRHLFSLRVHVRASIIRWENNPRLMFIQQYHQQERLSTAAAASATAVQLYMVGGWVGGSVMRGCLWVCCWAIFLYPRFYFFFHVQWVNIGIN